MNTVFNKMVSLSLYVALSILITNKVFATECGAIHFSNEVINDQQYVVVVRADNGVSVMDLGKYRDIVEGEYRYILAAGDHNLILDIWLKKDFSRMYRTWKRVIAFHPDAVKPEPTLTRLIKVSVTTDQFLQFSLSGPRVNANFELTNESSEKCNPSNLMPSQLFLDDETIANNPELPEVLEYRLARLMADIADDTLKHDNQVKVAVIANIAPLEVDTDFGIVLDDDNTRIKLLAVLPNSLADALGLVSSDIIIAMGGKPVDLKGTSAEDIVLSYLYSVKHNDALTMVVKRNDESIQLSHQYLPLAFPEASYQIYNQRKEGKVLIKKGMLINGYALPAALDYQYKQLRLAINDYIQGIKTSDGVITLVRAASFDKSFGIDVLIPTNKKGGIEILAIEPYSPAAKLGLRKSDVLLAINNQPLTNMKIEELGSLLTSLTVGENYSIKVSRSRQVTVLNDNYQPRAFPAFTLDITLISPQSIEVKLDFMYSMNRYSLSLENATLIRSSTENIYGFYIRNLGGTIPLKTLSDKKSQKKGYTDLQGKTHDH